MRNNLSKRAMLTVIKQYVPLLVMYGIFVAVFFVIARLYHQDLEPYIYATVLLLFFMIIVMGLSIYKQFQAARRRDRLLHGITSEWKNLPKAQTLAESDYQEMIQILGEEMTRISIARANENQEMMDYYSTWVHQVKTPIAVLRLLLESEDSEEYRAMKAELFRIEQYVEMALNYTRLGEGSSDLMVQEYQLDDLLKQAIRKYASQFIYKKIRLVYEPVSRKIVTDQKWFLCIVEQLLSNAVKYTPQGSVTISLMGNQLRIQDTGIGIDPADLPRIFEKGFTGINGRQKEQKSTGLGLYLCKKAADKINMPIHAESVVGEGSCFVLELGELGLQPMMFD